MKCPLLFIHWKTSKHTAFSTVSDCLKEECAWWDKDGSQCSQLAKMKVLVNIESCLELIVNKMPHEGQFRK